jgi:hypothetical protein
MSRITNQGPDYLLSAAFVRLERAVRDGDIEGELRARRDLHRMGATVDIAAYLRPGWRCPHCAGEAPR